MTLCDRLVYPSRVFAPAETIVLDVVDQLKEKDANKAVRELKDNGFPSKESVDHHKYSCMQ